MSGVLCAQLSLCVDFGGVMWTVVVLNISL